MDDFRIIYRILKYLRDAMDFEEFDSEEKGYEPPHYHDYNDFGREAQRVYDDLYLSND